MSELSASHDVSPIGLNMNAVIDGLVGEISRGNGDALLNAFRNTEMGRTQKLDTKPCPQCSMVMILDHTGEMLASYPAQFRMKWWCGCGHSEDAPVIREKTPEQLRRERWERVNGTGSGSTTELS